MPNDASSARQFWDRDEAVQSLDADTGALPYELDLINSAIERAEQSSPVQRIEVLGIGTGRELAAVRAAAPAALIRASDISPRMIAATQRTIDRLGLTNIETVASDVTELVTDGGQADVVIALSAVLCYPQGSPSRARAWSSLHALLRPEGVVAAVVQQRNGRPDWAVWFAARALAARLPVSSPEPGDRKSRDTTGHSVLFHHYTTNEIRRHLEMSRFSATDVRSLRNWARQRGLRLPPSSPNPLLILAAA